MPLGHSVRVSCRIQDPDLRAALAFYEQLGFAVQELKSVYMGATLSAGRLTLELRRSGQDPLTVDWFCADLGAARAHLDAAGLQVEAHGLARSRWLRFVEPRSGLVGRVYQRAPVLRAVPAPSSVLGTFAELSLATEDQTLDPLIDTFHHLGYRVSARPRSERPAWSTLDDGVLPIGVYRQSACQHPFTAPSLTWFSPGNTARIEALQGQGLTFSHTFSEVDGDPPEEAVLPGPAGLLLFLFAG